MICDVNILLLEIGQMQLGASLSCDLKGHGRKLRLAQEQLGASLESELKAGFFFTFRASTTESTLVWISKKGTLK